MKRIATFVFTAALAAGMTADAVAQSAERSARADQNETARSVSLNMYRTGASKTEMARFGPRIINGQPVAQESGDWAWAVSIQTQDGRHFCGGSLVAPRLQNGSVVEWVGDDRNPLWVVTAAHCVVNRDGSVVDPAELKVQSGNVSLIADPRVRQNVRQVLVHEDYDNVSLTNDIALLKLEPADSVPNDVVRTSIRLADGLDRAWLYKDYAALTVSGWGRTESGPISSTLERVVVPYVDAGTCEEAYAIQNESIAPGMLCAGFSSGGYDSCQGDSGGGLVFRPARVFGDPVNDPVLAGVVSWGIGCARPDLYGVYSNALSFRRWLDVTVAKNS